jgi:hypothetical protein
LKLLLDHSVRLELLLPLHSMHKYQQHRTARELLRTVPNVFSRAWENRASLMQHAGGGALLLQEQSQHTVVLTVGYGSAVVKKELASGELHAHLNPQDARSLQLQAGAAVCNIQLREHRTAPTAAVAAVPPLLVLLKKHRALDFELAISKTADAVKRSADGLLQTVRVDAKIQFSAKDGLQTFTTAASKKPVVQLLQAIVAQQSTKRVSSKGKGKAKATPAQTATGTSSGVQTTQAINELYASLKPAKQFVPSACVDDPSESNDSAADIMKYMICEQLGQYLSAQSYQAMIGTCKHFWHAYSNTPIGLRSAPTTTTDDNADRNDDAFELHPHQKIGLAFMLDREKYSTAAHIKQSQLQQVPKYMYYEIKTSSGSHIYVHKDTLVLYRTVVPCDTIKPVFGGALCDEPGLGK